MKFALYLLSLSLQAHHSLTAEFDLDRKVTLKGAVARVEWMNPHAWIHVHTESGLWAVEVGAPNELIRRGWSRSDLKQGTEVTIEAILAKKLPRTANARSIVLPDGKRVFNGYAPEPDAKVSEPSKVLENGFNLDRSPVSTILGQSGFAINARPTAIMSNSSRSMQSSNASMPVQAAGSSVPKLVITSVPSGSSRRRWSAGR